MPSPLTRATGLMPANHHPPVNFSLFNHKGISSRDPRCTAESFAVRGLRVFPLSTDATCRYCNYCNLRLLKRRSLSAEGILWLNAVRMNMELEKRFCFVFSIQRFQLCSKMCNLDATGFSNTLSPVVPKAQWSSSCPSLCAPLDWSEKLCTPRGSCHLKQQFFWSHVTICCGPICSP